MRTLGILSERAHCNELPLLVGKFPNLILHGLIVARQRRRHHPREVRMTHTLEAGIVVASRAMSLDIAEQALEIGFGRLSVSTSLRILDGVGVA